MKTLNLNTTTFKIDKKLIRDRKDRLEKVKILLKQDFVGIDEVIDNLLDYIQIWYLMPEILSRPIIVCLWGMTGVGKTDLVRRMVRYLEFQDRFAEMELGNSDDTTFFNSVGGLLSQEGFDDGKPAIVLFDEIQRFNTVDGNGESVAKTKFSDFWQLLSDGRLPKRGKDQIEEYVAEYMLTQRRKKRKAEKEKEQEGEEDNSYDYYDREIGLWEARNLKRVLRLEEDVMTLAEMTHYQVIELVLDATNDKAVYEPVDYSRLLILISGNLDEAFHMAGQTAEADIDADIFHAFTKKITSVDIKHALTNRFRPEQVARFGNIHLIYASLRRADFERLIRQEVARIITKTLERYGVQLTVGDNVLQLIYRNGVFPVQGVRPVFSSVVDILETHLSKFLFEALQEDLDRIVVDYDNTHKEIVANMSGLHRHREIRLPFVGRMDKIRVNVQEEKVLNVSVHEAGHAIAYVALFGLAPLQLKSRLADSYAEGFTFPHEIYLTRDSLVRKIMVYLAGGLAEELLFGPGNATIGRSHDRVMATRLTVDYIRAYGFDPNFQANYLQDGGYSLDIRATDRAVEHMIADLVAQTRQLLTDNQDFLLDLSGRLAGTGSLEAAEVCALARMYGLEVEVRAEGYLHLPDYTAMLKR
ncbi:MAG: peptidase M41 [Bacteroidetes bacterium]|nr:MAG: peptidase M41 [Bacteroidota bacterium]